MYMKGRVLLLGGNGMVGRNILSIANGSRWDFLSPKSKDLNLVDFESTLSFITKAKPDFIINAAGFVGGIKANINNPVNFLVNNIDIGRNLVIAARQASVKKLINLGASCMYPRNISYPLEEDMLLRGKLEPTNEGYALAKIMTAKLCQYVNSENSQFHYKTMIPCNIYGCFDKFDPERSHLVPAIIKKLHLAIVNNEEQVEIWGDGLARREFMYAGDFAEAIFYSLNNFDDMPQLLNIGVGEDHSINEYYEIISGVLGYEGNFIHDLDKPTGMQKKLVSIKKQTSWGWKPKTELKEGIEKTYDYFLKEIEQ